MAKTKKHTRRGAHQPPVEENNYDPTGVTKDRIVIDMKSCSVCAEKFNLGTIGAVRETRSDRKHKYAFCSIECEVLFDDGLL